MMNNKLLEAFNELSINDKRDKISNELIVIGSLINYIEKNYNIDNHLKIKNYNLSKDINKNEGEILTFLYEDIYNIEREIITITKLIMEDNK